MTKPWPMVPLGEVLTHRKEFIQIDDAAIYKRCRVKLHAQGIVLRDEVPGIEIKTKKQQVCRAGEFLVAEIDAKVGGFGIVPDALDAAIVSSHYFLFQVIEPALDKTFLDYFIRTPFFRDQVTAQGSTNYAAIRPKEVLGYKIPLPPLSEQKRIVVRIEELAAKIEEAKGLRQKAVEEAEALADAALSHVFSDKKHSHWEYGPISQFADINPSRRGLNLAPADFVSFVPMKAVHEKTGTITQAEVRPYVEVSKGYTWFADGDVIFARITPCMQNGKAALARNLMNKTGFGSTEFHVMRPFPDILGEWLLAIVRSKAFRDDAATHFTGTAGQQRVPQSFLQQKTIPVPPLSEQRRIIAYLDDLQAKVDSLKRLQAGTAAELDAMLPSVLDRAFKGEM